jgi:sulfite exporter TauE/SafE
MCSATCAGAVGRGGLGSSLGFHIARVAGYAAAGALAASSMGAVASWAQISPALRPLWTLLQAGAFGLGLWLLWRGRQPTWMAGIGHGPQGVGPGAWQKMRGPLRSVAAGSLWVAWPCGLLQSALLVAAMANSAGAGAAAMAGFALASAPGLVLGPWVWLRLLRTGNAAARERWATRAAGAMLVLASGWALGHGLWHQVAAFCATL